MGRTTPTTITPIMRMTIMTNQPIKTQRRDFTQGVSSTNLHLPRMYHQTQRRVHLWRKQLLWPRGGTLFALEDSSNKPYYINTVSHLNTLEKQEVTAWRKQQQKIIFECSMTLCFWTPPHLVPRPQATLSFNFDVVRTTPNSRGGWGEGMGEGKEMWSGHMYYAHVRSRYILLSSASMLPAWREYITQCLPF